MFDSPFGSVTDWGSALCSEFGFAFDWETVSEIGTRFASDSRSVFGKMSVTG